MLGVRTAHTGSPSGPKSIVTHVQLLLDNGTAYKSYETADELEVLLRKSTDRR